MATSDLGVVKPIMAGTHDKTKTYETLNIVEANSKTYMANKDVPVGTDITVQEFWLDLSGAVMTEQQLEAVSVSKPTVSNKIITQAEEQVITSAVAKNATDIASLTQGATGKIGAADYATATLGGTVKLRVAGTTCYITTNGVDA